MLLTRVLTLLKPVVKRTSYLYDTCVSIVYIYIYSIGSLNKEVLSAILMKRDV